MTDETLLRLADRAGLSSNWTDAFGRRQSVAPDRLRPILACLGLPADTEGDIRASLASFDRANVLPPLVTAERRLPFVVDARPGPFVIRLEGGEEIVGDAVEAEGGSRIYAPRETGYHLLEIDGQECILAVAPARGHTLRDAQIAAGRKPGRAWGISTQLYSLRRPRDGGIGDAGALVGLAREAGLAGADALSISPVHAQFVADLDRFSPYAPSSRVLSNVLHAAIDLEGEEAERLAQAGLIDWPRASALRLAALTAEYERAVSEDALSAFDSWRERQDESLELHARFETLHHHMFRRRGLWNWRDWPDEFRDPFSERSREFTDSRRDEVRMHAWFQYRIDTGLAVAHETARGAGMAVGIVSDLAVGTDPGGSHCWSRQDETLLGLSVGAPPDLLSRSGQNWGITAFAPAGLRRNGFRAFVEMLRAAMRHAGGVRIDHAMGLNRLWVIPEGASAADGAYLSMPETDLLRLIRLESSREQAIVLGEDLGTVPEGFAERLGQGGIDGMRVLWFEEENGRHRPPADWTVRASAMTSTHDLPTVAGWWKGVDLDWNERLGRGGADDRETRATARGALWEAMRESGAADGPCPADWDTYPVVDAAIRHVGRSACEIAMLPIEDLLGLEQAPNLPGTTDEHPNWRRRLDPNAGDILSGTEIAARVAGLSEIRGG